MTDPISETRWGLFIVAMMPHCTSSKLDASVRHIVKNQETEKREMGKKSDGYPSPCVGICKDRRGICIACGRTKKDKKAWKDAKGDKEQIRLLERCAEKADEIGTREFWEKEYRRRCAKKGVKVPAFLALQAAE